MEFGELFPRLVSNNLNAYTIEAAASIAFEAGGVVFSHARAERTRVRTLLSGRLKLIGRRAYLFKLH
jgi:hypothetical protein